MIGLEIVRELTIDVAKENTFAAINAKQYDKATRFIVAQLTNYGEPIVVAAGSTVTINFRRDDNQTKAFAGTVLSDGRVRVPIPYFAVECDGDTKASISVSGNDNDRATTLSFIIRVQEAEFDGDGISEDDNYDLLLALITEVNNVEDSIKTAEASRVTAENSRVQTEAQRQANESARQSNESQRQTNETARISSENSRVSNENTRSTNESTRIANEQERQTDETTRANNELVREQNETIRQANEEQRKANESNRVNAIATAQDTADYALEEIDDVKKQLSDISINPDDLGLEQDGDTGYVYPTYKGVRSENGIPLAATGGGGGGSSATYTITLKNLLESRSYSIPESGEALIKISYSSVDCDGEDDGAGVGTLTVDGVKKATLNIAQGDNTIDVKDYLAAGSNTVKIKVENSEGLTKSISYTITVVALSITTTFDTFTMCSGDTTFYYTPTGTGNKTVHFVMDGEELESVEVKSSGRSQSYVIDTQSHGAHIFEVYAEMTVEGVTVKSNTLKLCLTWVQAGNSTPIVQSVFDTETCTQGEILSIPYFAYNPSSELAAVKLSVISEDGSTYSEKTISVGRTAQTWVVEDYPMGKVTFRVSLGDEYVDNVVEVEDSGVELDHITDSLVLYFDPTGRSNSESEPAQWTDGTTSAVFNNVSFTSADGWLNDTDGNSVLRLLPGSNVYLPYKLFATDKRTSGFTVEVEMATHNVRDYDTIVMSCLSGGRGFEIASQSAELTSEQSSLSMQFKEDERVRVTFVVEPRNLNRLIYVYVDGVMCGTIQYPDNDDFAQTPAVGITIGAESSGIDVYRIYLYDKGLTRNEVLDNYISDRATLKQRLNAHYRNDIFNSAEEVTISKLPNTLPYMIISCAELPQYKGDKKTGVEITYVNPSDSSKSFTATGVEMDVQGTSSAGYKKKNFKIKLKGGLTYTADNTTASKYKLRDTSIPVSTFCMKADVASSEGTNNVELVRLYNDVSPYKTAAQQTDSRVRVGIDGVPCVIFWQNTTSGETKFWGKYNFNNDKSTAEVYGLTDGCESWEICNNTSNRVLFKSSDYTSSDWKNDFEARYPEDNTDYTNLKRLTDWIVSTDRSAVSTEAEKTDRLQRFKDEFEDYFVKDSMLFYYLFTEAFLMVDSRAKNFFPTTYDGTHWMPLPYDFDTAIGINNEGQLVFDYNLEDTDKVDGANVFNGQESVLWCNIRDAFADDLKAMYKTLRSGSTFNYSEVISRFTEHQSVWCEAIWNEDAYEKYLEPLLTDNDSSYLTMLQGNKSSQRSWWLYNAFRYRDSKYQTGDAANEFITLRCYEKGDISITPYRHIYAHIKYGSYDVMERAVRNTQITLANPSTTLNDTEVYIYSADCLADIGDLSPLQVGYANFSSAVKLTKLKLGDEASDYQNTHLTELYVGNNELLSELDIRNCVSLSQAVDLSGCIGIETVLAGGSHVAAINLPVGGKVKYLELPETITNLTIKEQTKIATFTNSNFPDLTTLDIENSNGVPVWDILMASEKLNRVRLIGVKCDLRGQTDDTLLNEYLAKLKTCGGLDASGLNTDNAVLSGYLYVDSITDEQINDLNALYPDLIVVVKGKETYSVHCVTVDYSKVFDDFVTAGNSYTVKLGDYIGNFHNNEISVTMNGLPCEYTYDESTGVLTVDNITGRLVITVDLPKLDAPTISLADDGYTLTVTPADNTTKIAIYVDDKSHSEEDL